MRSKRTRELPQLPLLFHRPAPITLTTLKQRDLEHFSYRCSGTGRCQCGFSLKKSHVKWISALYIITRNALTAALADLLLHAAAVRSSASESCQQEVEHAPETQR